MPLVQAEQADAEGGEICPFVAHQWHAGGRLQAQGEELLAVLQAGIVGVADHHARCLEARCRHAGQSARREQRTHLATELDLLGAQLVEAVGLRLAHHRQRARQRVGRHRGVVRMAAAFVGFHDLQPLLQVGREAGAGGAVDALARQVGQHHERAAGRSAPALLRRAHQHVDAGGAHVHPHRAAGDAVQHEQAARGMHRVTHGAQVGVGQHHAGGGFHMGREHHVGLLARDGGHHLVDRRGRERRGLAGAGAARLQHDLGRGDAAHLEDLRQR